MNANFNFYAQPPAYQPLPSAPPYVTVPVNVPVPVAVAVAEKTNDTDKGCKKTVGVFMCFGLVALGVYLLTYWANHVTAS